MILYAERVFERKNVGELGTVPHSKLTAAEDGITHVRPVFFRLSAVEPECIPSLRKKFAG